MAVKPHDNSANTTVPHEQADSYFFQFPAEVRNMIYEYLFTNEVDIRYCTAGKRNAGLVLACRATHYEALTLYYQLTPFLSFGDSFSLTWLSTIPFARMRMISELRCDVTLAAWGCFWASEEEHKREQYDRIREFMMELLKRGIVFREGVVTCRQGGRDEGREVWKKWSDMKRW